MPFIVPGSYLLTASKPDFEEKYENIMIREGESKSIRVNVAQMKKLQLMNFNIEPYGTKIFINSVYEGRSPVKKALSTGDYVISARNDLYDNYRYLLKISDVTSDEKTVVFHLKSKNLKTYFELKQNLYYASFWNFTFSLAATIPTIIFAYDYFYKFGAYSANYYQVTGRTDYQSTADGQIVTALYYTFYGMAWGLSIHLAASLVWLFYALSDYLSTKDKIDFIPIMEYYQAPEGSEGISLGASFRF
jgi:hypothetical protein